MPDMKDYLTEDNFLPSDQKYVCLSFLTPKKDDKTTITGIKIRGVFSNYDDACKQAKNIQEIDPYFNVFVGEMGKWLPFDPAPDSKDVKDAEYANQELNNLMKGYMENQEKAKIYHEQRKNTLIRENLMENINKRKQNVSKLEKKLKKTNDKVEKQRIEDKIKRSNEEMNKLSSKKNNIDEEISRYEEELKQFGVRPSQAKILQMDANGDIIRN